ncbi:TonB-dependent receptor plug domain-containing protein [Dysgonomonas sp. Marseille-P4677]|uniref:TonB-dependent receptor n=1 Tax=Dysgonomonas sp. Marseille-P4677 TaxID=2364790 RepID=UPI0019136A53|nr:TonB-dependent receptor plug domain-containing protein [Dysgonomonas sp. Marseille-P4677]MBK5722319.1 TonB-dependent receptor plug domain-containing protein [Dysgonomonas sp. Marseille-P4677]
MFCTRFFKIVFFITLFFIGSEFIHAQSKLDSLQHLQEIVVTAKTYKEVIPAQKLSGEELKALNSFSVADAIRYFSGIQIKDYGGIGGLKTVNIRSLGTHHVGVFYDGIQLGNAQNGQIDLGKFSLDNMEEISLYNGQKSDIFQPAKDFGSSGSVYLRSRTPKFQDGKYFNLKGTVKTGSFDLINPSILYEHKISNKVSTSFNAEVINASGKYRYRYKRVFPNSNEVMYDTTAVRKNGDIYSLRLEGGLYGTINDGFWKVKTYFYDSNKGIPGAIVNNKWKNSQRQRDRNFFTQGSFQKNISRKYEIQANVKYAYDYMNYVNPDTTLMLIDNTFKQQELYTSLSNKYSIAKNWDVALSADVQYNTLRSDLDGFVFPKRLTTLIAVATAVELGRVKMQGSLLTTLVRERINSGNTVQNDSVRAAPDKKEFTPAFFISYKPFRKHDLNMRAFYKNIFRMPTFNDLYYTDIGNITLKPEFTHQFNIGFQYSKSLRKRLIKQIQLQADAYYNEVTDKIVAVPKGSGQYRWMMMNLGYVKIRGIEASSTTIFQLPYDILLNLRLSYTYQKAQDFTKRKSQALQETTYGGQIPYIPWHSGSVIAAFTYKSWQLNYSFIYVGERYHSSANIREEYEQPWYTHDMTLVKNLKIKNIGMRIAAEINNLFSQDYEVVLNYPMPKRNYRISFTVEL